MAPILIYEVFEVNQKIEESTTDTKEPRSVIFCCQEIDFELSRNSIWVTYETSTIWVSLKKEPPMMFSPLIPPEEIIVKVVVFIS